MQRDPVQLVLGPSGHGVTRYARQLADAGNGPRQARLQLSDAPPPAGPVHLQLTPQLLGATPEQAAERLEQWCTDRSAPVTITLHDLPQPSDGADLFARRAGCVRRWLAVTDGVAVSSRHEAALLAEFAPSARPWIIPLPVDPPPRLPAPVPDGSLGVLGFLYPGKGHAEAIAAAAVRDPAPPVRFLGAVSPGHQELADSLADSARAGGVPLRLTGHLEDADWADQIASIGVPLALHRHLSASGSINSWVAHRRRPLVARSRYAEELAELRPGTLTLIEPDELDAAVDRALSRPESTVLPGERPPGPDTAATLAAYRRFWRSVG